MLELFIILCCVFVFVAILHYIAKQNKNVYDNIPEYTCEQLQSVIPGTLIKFRGTIVKTSNANSQPLYEKHTHYVNDMMFSSYTNKSDVSILSNITKINLFGLPFDCNFNFNCVTNVHTESENSFKLTKKLNLKFDNHINYHSHVIDSITENTPVYVIGQWSGNSIVSESNSLCGIYSSTIEADSLNKNNTLKTYRFISNCLFYITLFTGISLMF